MAEKQSKAEEEPTVADEFFSELDEQVEPEPKEPVRYLDDNFSAECPIDGFTGKVTYPAIMDIGRYKTYRQVIADTDEEDMKMTFAFVTLEESGQVEPVWFSVLYYTLAVTLGKLEIETPPGYDIKNVNTMPLGMVVWLAITAKEWLENQLTFRLHRG